MIPGLGFLSPFAPSDSDVISPGSRGSKRSRADADLDDDVFVSTRSYRISSWIPADSDRFATRR
jgi:hypothetical protein